MRTTADLPRTVENMYLRMFAATATAVLVAFGLPTASAGPVTGPPSTSARAAAPENGAAVVVPAAPAKLKRARCTASNRTVGVTAKASKKIKGRVYGVEATRTLSLCTTTKNKTKVYATALALKPVNGLVKVTVTAGATTQAVRNGVTTVTTPLAAKGKFLFTTYRVTGTLRTVVDRYGKVTSQVLNIERV